MNSIRVSIGSQFERYILPQINETIEALRLEFSLYMVAEFFLGGPCHTLLDFLRDGGK